MLSCGNGVFEVSGYAEGDIMGKPLVDAFGLSGFADDKDPMPGRARMGRPKARPARDDAAPLRAAQAVRLDLFPAYDEDGGMLASLAPEMNGQRAGDD